MCEFVHVFCESFRRFLVFHFESLVFTLRQSNRKFSPVRCSLCRILRLEQTCISFLISFTTGLTVRFSDFDVLDLSIRPEETNIRKPPASTIAEISNAHPRATCSG